MKQHLKIVLYYAVFFLLILSVGFGLTHRAQAQSVSPPIVSVNFPCPDGSFGLGDCPPSTNIPDYINNLYKFAVGIAGLLALGMIVGGGVYYTVSAGSSDKQREARDMITSAVWGVVLLLGSYLILNTINPKITSLSLSFGGAGTLTTTSTLAGAGNQNASECGDYSKISFRPNNLDLEYKQGCDYRKNFLKQSVSLSNDEYYNDNVIFKTGITADSDVWMYPYFVRSKGTSSAQCLIYAYRDLGAATNTVYMIKLNEDLGLCAPRDQKMPPSTYGSIIITPSSTLDCSDVTKCAKQFNVPSSPQNAQDLTTLMSCIAGNLSADNITVNTTYTSDRDHLTCNFTRGQSTLQDSTCSHTVNSCHYGGHNGTQGAEAVDYPLSQFPVYTGNAGQKIVDAATKCGVTAGRARCEAQGGAAASCTGGAANHVHVDAPNCDAN